MREKDEQAYTSTDRELWRERPGDYYADSIHVTEGGGIGINVGGHVIVMHVRDWHFLARERAAQAAPSSCPNCEAAEAAQAKLTEALRAARLTILDVLPAAGARWAELYGVEVASERSRKANDALEHAAALTSAASAPQAPPSQSPRAARAPTAEEVANDLGERVAARGYVTYDDFKDALLSAEQRGREAGIGEAAKEAEKGGCDCNFAPCPHDDAGKNIAWSIRALLSRERASQEAPPSDAEGVK